MAINFDTNQDFSFLLATASGGIDGFSPDQFRIDSSRFLNDLGGGGFYISQSGNNLLLNFSAVPEPGSASLLVLTALVFSFRRNRNQRDIEVFNRS